MNRFNLILIIAFLAMNGLYGQGKDTTKTESKVELKVVYEKTFDEPIVDVIFDTATVSIDEAKNMGWKDEAFKQEDKAKGKVLVSYPKVVLTSQGRELSWLPDGRRNSYYAKDLRFYDHNGKMINSLVLKKYGEEHIYFSPQRKYILVSRRPTEWNPSYTGGTLYYLDGKKIWEIEGPTLIAVSDEGYAIGAYLDWQVPPEPGGDFYVYDSKGKLITTIENPAKDKVSPLYAEFSKDGEYVLLTFVKEAATPTIFLLTTKAGNILWEKEMLEAHYTRVVGEIDILSNKGILGCIYKGRLYAFFLNWTSNLRWTAPLTGSGYGSCVLSQDGERAYISSSRGYLWCLNTITGDIIWMHKEPWSPPIDSKRRTPNTPEFIEIYVESKNIIVNGTYKIFLFDSEIGTLKTVIEYPDKKIFLSLHNGIIFVIDATNNKVEGLKIKEE
ncbi:MAG: hypothetical protein ABIL74_11265 [candidate division WOR-3 bacterium]